MGGADNWLMGFGDMSNLMSGIIKGAAEKNAAQQQYNDVVVEQTSQVRDSAAAQQLIVNQANAEMAGILADRKEADAMGQTLLGQIMLHGSSILEPMKYTPEGLASREQTAQMRVQMGSQAHQAQIAVSNAAITEAEARSNRTIFNAESASNALTARVQGLSMMAQGIGASENLRTAKLSQMQASEIDQLLLDPNLAKTGMVESNGFKYNATELRERKNDLLKREMLSKLSPAESDPEYITKMRTHQELNLMYMSHADLIGLRDNGYVMPDGSMADPARVDSFLADTAAREQTRVQEAIATGLIPHQLPQYSAELNGRLNSYRRNPAFVPGTRLGDALNTMQLDVNAVLNPATQSAAAAGGPQTQGLLLKGLMDSESVFMAKVDDEVKSRAGGDTALAPILKAQILGQPVEPGQVLDYVSQQYTKSKPFNRVFEPKQAAALQGIIDKHLADIQQRESMNFGAGTMSKSEMRAQAAQEGFAEFSQQNSIEALRATDTLAFQRQDNPLVAAGISRGEYDSLSAQAAALARDNVAATFNLNPEQIAAVVSHTSGAAGVPPETAAQVGAALDQQSTMLEFDLLESKSPGLGQKYAAWITTNIGDLTDKANQALNRHMAPLYHNDAADGAMQVASNWAMAEQASTGRAEQVLKESYMKARDPERMLRISMSISGLEPREQQLAFDNVVMPILNNAAKNKLSPDQTVEQVMNALENPQGQSAEVQKAAQRMLRVLPAALGNYETMLQAMTDPKQVRAMAADGRLTKMNSAIGGPSAVGFNPLDPTSATARVLLGEGPTAGGGVADPRRFIESQRGLSELIAASKR